MATGSQSPSKPRGVSGHRANALGSVIGRRFLATFAACAMVPLGALATFALLQVRSNFEAEAHKRLESSAKAVGSSILERLLFLETDLDSLASQLASDLAVLPRINPHLRRRISERFDGLALLAPDGQRLATGLEPIGRLPEIDLRDDDRLAAGQAMLLAEPDEDGAGVFMVRAVDTELGSCLLAGRIRTDYLWGRAAFLPPGTDLVVLGRDGLLLHSSSGLIPDAQEREALLDSDADGRLRWQHDDVDYLGASSQLALGYRFSTRWVVTLNQSLDASLRAFHEFCRFFILVTALSLVLMLLLSMIRIRQTLRPVGMLREATRRVADGDFGVSLDIDSGDEFEHVGRAFNEMVASLEESVRERNRTELELIQAWREADDAKRTENEFIQNVSHEFRTPLTSILSAAAITRDYAEDDPESRREFMSIIATETQRLTELIDSVLDLSEMRSDRAWTLDPLDLCDVLREAVDAHAEAAADRDITLQLALPETALPAVANRKRLGRVVYHLVSNAVKFSADGGSVAVRARAAGRYLEVEVQDHGCGDRLQGSRDRVPAVPPAQSRHIDRQAEGHRPRSGDGQDHHRAARRQDRAGERARSGCAVPVHSAAAPRCRVEADRSGGRGAGPPEAAGGSVARRGLVADRNTTSSRVTLTIPRSCAWLSSRRLSSWER